MRTRRSPLPTPTRAFASRSRRNANRNSRDRFQLPRPALVCPPPADYRSLRFGPHSFFSKGFDMSLHSLRAAVFLAALIETAAGSPARAQIPTSFSPGDFTYQFADANGNPINQLS